jgi:type IV pilus assembly protein PilX
MNMNTHSSPLGSRVGPLHMSHRRQNGAVLIISLFILLIMTLVGITSMSTTSLEEKMAGNMRDKNIALQASEAALEDGEGWLASLGSEPSDATTCGSPPCDVWALNILPSLADQSASWWQSNAREYGTAGTKDISDVNTDPYYVVEAQAYVRDNLDAGQNPPTGRNFYRVTARGTGGSDDAQAVLQSTYVKRFN